MIDALECRVLAAFRCVDAISGGAVSSGLTVISRLPTWQNRSSTYVIYETLRGDSRGGSLRFFDSSRPSSFEVSIKDASGRYLSRSANLPARSASERIAAGGDPATLFNPQSVMLFPSPSFPTSPDWAVIRVSARRNDGMAGLPWAVVQISDSSTGAVLATTMTDLRGEGLLAIPQLTAEAEAEVYVIVTGWFDSNSLNRYEPFLPDPDRVLNNLHLPAWKTSMQGARIVRGEVVNVKLLINV